VVVALGSPVLETMFDFNQRQQAEMHNEEVEMDADDVPPESMKQLLNYLYLKPATLTAENVFAVMATGFFYFFTVFKLNFKFIQIK
jgi:hypothetical protein